jgi:subtilisin family serine protease
VVDSASYYPDAFDGTSSAAPHVAGAAALIREAFPHFTPADIGQFLRERALDLGPTGPDNDFGAGRLNLNPAEESAPPQAAQKAPPLAESDSSNPVPATVEIRPTSTPRTVLISPAADLPDESGPTVIPPTDDEEGGLALVIWAGLCLMCLAGLILLFVLAAAIILAIRRR